MQIPIFKDPNLLRKAFTHRSFLNEHKDEKESNERLEFLGDSILSFVVSSWLYTNMPDKPEGELTNMRSNLVNTKSLAKVALSLDIGSMILLSKGEEDGGGRSNPSLLADTFEAVVGALFLDQGLVPTQEFITAALLANPDELASQNLKDAKSLLQEIVQSKKLPTPTYEVVSQIGPDHNKVFTIAVKINDQQYATGTGKSKREAETDAASAALAKFGNSW